MKAKELAQYNASFIAQDMRLIECQMADEHKLRTPRAKHIVVANDGYSSQNFFLCDECYTKFLEAKKK